MYIYVSFLLKCKIHLYSHDSVKEHLHYATVKFKIQIYIYIMLLEITLSRQAEAAEKRGQDTLFPKGPVAEYPRSVSYISFSGTFVISSK
jgi:hypothetical protein